MVSVVIRETLIPIMVLLIILSSLTILLFVKEIYLSVILDGVSTYTSIISNVTGINIDNARVIIYIVFIAGFILALAAAYLSHNVWLSLLNFLKTLLYYYAFACAALMLLAWYVTNDTSHVIYGINLVAAVIATYIITSKVPAVSVHVYVKGGKESTIDDESSRIIITEPHASIVVAARGEYSAINIAASPGNMFHIEGPRLRGSSYEYTVVPLENGEGTLTIRRGRTIILEYNVLVKGLEKRAFNVEIYFNDRRVSEERVAVEINKSLGDALSPLVNATLRKIGIGEAGEDVIHEILVMDEEGKILDLTTPIRKLSFHGDRLRLKIYATDELSEILRRFGEESFEALWENLMKRLEVLGLHAESLTDELSGLSQRLGELGSRWW